ncbi:MAG: nitrilase-related carbon-nitrogen hydrolase, partial [Gaiellaceae bacterium]
MRERVRVACIQAEPAILDRAATLDKLALLAAEAAGAGAGLAVFPETFVPAYPSSAWAKALAGWADPRAKEAFALFSREALEVPGPDADRIGEIAREHELWLVVGVNERNPERPGTLYNALLYFAPDGNLALHHRKLVPTNHERLVWGQGDGAGLRAIETGLGRVGGLICWENYMPLARFSLYESGVEIYIASTADDGDAWQATLVHIARESRAFVVAPSHFQRSASYPDDFPLRSLIEEHEVLGRGGSAILGPDGSYLAGPLYDE